MRHLGRKLLNLKCYAHNQEQSRSFYTATEDIKAVSFVLLIKYYSCGACRSPSICFDCVIHLWLSGHCFRQRIICYADVLFAIRKDSALRHIRHDSRFYWEVIEESYNFSKNIFPRLKFMTKKKNNNTHCAPLGTRTKISEIPTKNMLRSNTTSVCLQ